MRKAGEIDEYYFAGFVFERAANHNFGLLFR